MDPRDMRIVLPSRRRVAWCRESLKLWPTATVCVGEEEAADYRALGCEVVTHPDNIVGLGRLRQWIIEHFTERCIIQVNDDIRGLWCVVGKRSRVITDPPSIWQILLNSATIAEGLGISCFAYSRFGGDVRMFEATKPFSVKLLDCSLFGMIDRNYRFDPNVSQCDDVDLTLQCLLKERIVWTDVRFAPVRLSNGGFSDKMEMGGNAVSRGVEQTKREVEYLQKKWGAYYTVRWVRRGDAAGATVTGSHLVSSVSVERQQDLVLED
jgi:hypothetical protein